MNDASAGEPCVDAVRARMRQDPGQVRSVDERQGFVWLASYPKSGSTWMRALLANFLAGAGPAVPMDALPFRTVPSGFRFGELAGVAMEDFTRDEIGSLIPAFFRMHRRLCIAEQRMGARSHLYGKVHGAYVLNRAGQPLFPDLDPLLSGGLGEVGGWGVERKCLKTHAAGELSRHNAGWEQFTPQVRR